MRTFAYVCTIAISIAVLAPGASARVIGGDLDNGVAVYYFTSLTDSGEVLDYSGNRLHGALFNAAQLSTAPGRKYLSLGRDAADFQAWGDKKPLLVLKEFSIVAWVRVPQQPNDFDIQIQAYNGSLANAPDTVKAISEGRIALGVFSSGDIFGSYVYTFNSGGSAAAALQSTGRWVNNNQWQHIGFVINNTSTRLYLNGNRIADETIRGHESFAGTGSFLSIGTDARGNVDEVGFFKNDLTDTQVRLIYDHGLANIINVASVDPVGKASTTWGALKQR